MSSAFLDTNIVLDILIGSREKHQKGKELILYLLENDFEIVISEDMLSTIYYVSKNKEMTLKFFQVIQNEWTILAYGKEVISKSLEFSLKNSSDLEDTLQCVCAKEYQCDFLITNDKKFVNCGITIFDYESYI